MDIRQDVLDRFLRYVQIDTQSQEGVDDRYPSTDKQLVLARLLFDELNEIGLENVNLDTFGIVSATVPATIPSGFQPAKKIPTVGLLAHLDTYPGVSGSGVKPIVHRSYQGGDIKLPAEGGLCISPDANPELRQCIGDDIVTSDGSTLLGADDKAGVAEIMTFMRLLKSDRSIPHPRIRVGFTPDEEVGNGTAHFDVKAFGAEVAYTQDGSGIAEIEDETFCADSATVSIRGVDVHPGYAKGKMVNAVSFAAEFAARLPKDQSPETTKDRDGYLHGYQIRGTVSDAHLAILVRDFSVEGLKRLEEKLFSIRDDLQRLEPRVSIKVDVKESYRNMKFMLKKIPLVVDYAAEAVSAVGLTPQRKAIRGGTDGARLSFMGLPTPNLSAGGYNFHSRLEWVPVGGMVKAIEVLRALMRIYIERGW
jgi:tripeptide aminopeptidase